MGSLWCLPPGRMADLPSSGKAYVAGVVFTISYDQGPWSIYGNAPYSSAMGSDIIYAQFNFAPDEFLIMIKMDRIGRRRLRVQQGHEYQTRVSIDFIAQSGLRASTPTVPNGAPAGICGRQRQRRPKT